MQLDRRNTSTDSEAELEPKFLNEYKIETSFKHIPR